MAILAVSYSTNEYVMLCSTLCCVPGYPFTRVYNFSYNLSRAMSVFQLPLQCINFNSLRVQGAAMVQWLEFL